MYNLQKNSLFFKDNTNYYGKSESRIISFEDILWCLCLVIQKKVFHYFLFNSVLLYFTVLMYFKENDRYRHTCHTY